MSFLTRSYKGGWLHFITPPHLADDPPAPAYVEAQFNGQRLGRWATEASARAAIRKAHATSPITHESTPQ